MPYRDTIIAHRSRVIAAKGAMVRTTPRSQHRVVSILWKIVQTPIHKRQVIQGRYLRPTPSSDHFAFFVGEDDASQVAQIACSFEAFNEIENGIFSFAEHGYLRAV